MPLRITHGTPLHTLISAISLRKYPRRAYDTGGTRMPKGLIFLSWRMRGVLDQLELVAFRLLESSFGGRC